MLATDPETFPTTTEYGPALLLGGGCTSGHGICGVARWSDRSIAATVIFMLVAMVTVAVTRHVVGG